MSTCRRHACSHVHNRRRPASQQFGPCQTALRKGLQPRRDGNWDETDVDSVTEARVHNSVNELTARTVGQDPQIALSYDDAGNLTQDGSADGDHQYVWDYRNRLIEVKERQSGNWVTVGEYKYDARTRRILKTVTNKGTLNGVTAFTWGGDSDWQCLEERNGDGDLVARFTYSPGYIDAVAVQERDLNSDDDFGDAGEVVYYHSNTLFSVYALTDAAEDAVERYRYDAYGAATVLDDDWSTDADGLSDVANSYTFTGRRLDPESGLMQYRNRPSSTPLGRFLSQDFGLYSDGLNLYLYASCAPTNYADPTGRVAAGPAIAAGALGYTIIRDAISGSGGNITWKFDKLEGYVWVDDTPLSGNIAWSPMTTHVIRWTFENITGLWNVAEIEWDVSFYYYQGSISQVIPGIVGKSRGPCWSGSIEVEVSVVPGTYYWPSEAHMDFEGKLRQVDLRVTYEAHSWLDSTLRVSRWRLVGDGSIYRLDTSGGGEEVLMR